MLGPKLFLIYINDLDEEIISKLGKFADDTKMCKGIKNIEDNNILQQDLDTLHNWTSNWQMQFNTDKCSVIHVGNNNPHHKYKLGDNSLKSSVKEKDLGIIVDDKMKFSEQCSAAVKKANSTLGLIRRTIKYKRKDVIV